VNRALNLILASAASVSINAFAESSPGSVVTAMTEQVLAQIANGPVADRAQVRSVIESTVMPNVDFRAMTARAVGPQWNRATEDQRTRLMSGFEALLIKTYTGAFAEASGATFRLKQTIALDSETAEVRSDVVLRSGGDPVAMNYRLALRDDQWKITDVSVMGVWLVSSYHAQFTQVMERSGGLDGLIQTLEARGL
jgi:phospholipid transport system substrate-binding protein